jgi:hypothetical protein
MNCLIIQQLLPSRDSQGEAANNIVPLHRFDLVNLVDGFPYTRAMKTFQDFFALPIKTPF